MLVGMIRAAHDRRLDARCYLQPFADPPNCTRTNLADVMLQRGRGHIELSFSSGA